MRTKEQLRNLAVDYSEGKIFTNRHCQNEREVLWAFKPLMFGTLPPKNTALVYEYRDQHKGLYMNGVPSFWSCWFFNKTEFKLFCKYVDEYSALKKAFVAK